MGGGIGSKTGGGMITTLVVEDEAPARSEFKRFLQNEPDFD